MDGLLSLSSIEYMTPSLRARIPTDKKFTTARYRTTHSALCLYTPLFSMESVGHPRSGRFFRSRTDRIISAAGGDAGNSTAVLQPMASLLQEQSSSEEHFSQQLTWLTGCQTDAGWIQNSLFFGASIVCLCAVNSSHNCSTELWLKWRS